MELEQEDGGDVPPSPSEPASPRVRTSPRKSTKLNARKSTATSVGGDEYAREGDSRLSLASTKSKSHRTHDEDDEDDEQDDVGDVQSFAGDALENINVGDQTFDMGGDDDAGYDGYDDAGDASQIQDDEQEYDDVSMERAAVERGDHDGEVSEEEEQVEVRPKSQPTSKSKPQSKTQSRAPRVESQAAKKKRMRLSRMGPGRECEIVSR